VNRSGIFLITFYSRLEQSKMDAEISIGQTIAVQ